jgi:hypothetical protein
MKKSPIAVAELWDRPNLSMLEAMRATGYTRRQLTTLLKNGKVRHFKEGALYRVSTASLKEYFNYREQGAE